MNRAIGRDGRWHGWEELTPDEQREWMEAMTYADETWERLKTDTDTWTVRQSLQHYEQKRRMIN